MPVAMVQEWAEGGHDTENYDAIIEKMGVRENPPDGMHRPHGGSRSPTGPSASSTSGRPREHFERFMQDRLMPAVREVVGATDAPPPSMTIYELHGFQLV